MQTQKISKSIDYIRSVVAEHVTSNHKDLILDELTKLEFKMLANAKATRDKVRTSLDAIREEYRPIRAMVEKFDIAVHSQVDEISSKCTTLERLLRE